MNRIQETVNRLQCLILDVIRPEKAATPRLVYHNAQISRAPLGPASMIVPPPKNVGNWLWGMSIFSFSTQTARPADDAQGPRCKALCDFFSRGLFAKKALFLATL